MAEPARNTETGGRSLADILREAGIENPSRSGRRRRWDDVDDAGIRQRQRDADEAATRAGYGRRSSDLPMDRPAATGDRRDRDGDTGRDLRRGEHEVRRPRDERAVVREDRTGRVDRVDRDPREDRTGRMERVERDSHRSHDDHALRQDRGPREDRRREDRRREESPARERRGGRGGRESRGAAPDPSTAAIPGLRPSRTPSVPGATGATAVTAAPERRRPSTDHPSGPLPSGPLDLDPGPSTGPIPALAVDDVAELTDEDAGPRESALAWLRFAGELVIAAAAGVGIYFAFTVLWQTLPYAAVVLAPLAVTGLVAGVTMWRQRLGHAQLGARLLAVLVFAGTLLTVLPAAGLITRA